MCDCKKFGNRKLLLPAMLRRAITRCNCVSYSIALCCLLASYEPGLSRMSQISKCHGKSLTYNTSLVCGAYLGRRLQRPSCCMQSLQSVPGSCPVSWHLSDIRTLWGQAPRSRRCRNLPASLSHLSAYNKRIRSFFYHVRCYTGIQKKGFYAGDGGISLVLPKPLPTIYYT